MQKLLCDTDILLILVDLELFDLTIDSLFKLKRSQVHILDAVQYQLDAASFQKQYNELTINRMREILPELTNISQVSEADRRILQTLQPIEEIDPGEALLIANAIVEPRSILLSGDKRWIKAICLNRKKSVRRIKHQLKGRVLSLEHLLTTLINKIGFETIAGHVAGSKTPHRFFRIIFPTEVEDPESHCREGLLSYVGELEVTAGQDFL